MDSGGIGLDLSRVEGEEFVTHVGILVGYWVERCVDGTAELDWTSEASLRGRCGVLVIAVGAWVC